MKLKVFTVRIPEQDMRKIRNKYATSRAAEILPRPSNNKLINLIVRWYAETTFNKFA